MTTRAARTHQVFLCRSHSDGGLRGDPGEIKVKISLQALEIITRVIRNYLQQPTFNCAELFIMNEKRNLLAQWVIKQKYLHEAYHTARLVE